MRAGGGDPRRRGKAPRPALVSPGPPRGSDWTEADRRATLGRRCAERSHQTGSVGRLCLSFMSAKAFLARKLAAAFLAGRWSAKALVRRAAEACGGKQRWLSPLARRALLAFPQPPAAPGD